MDFFESTKTFRRWNLSCSETSNTFRLWNLFLKPKNGIRIGFVLVVETVTLEATINTEVETVTLEAASNTVVDYVSLEVEVSYCGQSLVDLMRG